MSHVTAIMPATWASKSATPQVCASGLRGAQIALFTLLHESARPVQYKWFVFENGDGRMVRDWTTSSTFAWTPAQPGTAYRVAFWVRDAATTADTSAVNHAVPYVVVNP